MSNILTWKDMHSGDTFSGVTLLKTMCIGKTRNGSDYIFGAAAYQTTQIQYKIWDSAMVSQLKAFISPETGFTPCLAQVSGTVKTYNGALDYTFLSVSMPVPESAEMSIASFLPSLDCEALWSEFTQYITTHISAPYLDALRCFFTPEFTQSFKYAWAAAGHHDAIAGGLLNHVLKMLRYADAMLTNHRELSPYGDIMRTGIILHDIGKVQEITNGVYTRNSFSSHRLFGIEMLAQHKAAVVASIGIDAYYRLQSIIIGHHDRFGTPADTVWAYLTHLIDMLDAWATEIAEYLSGTGKEPSIAATGEHWISGDEGHRLYF